MTYHLSTIYAGKGGFDAAVEAVKDALAANDFQVLTRIDVAPMVKSALDADIRPYVILGACNPGFTLRALHEEPLSGLVLPYNVVVRELEDGRVEVAAVDPFAAMHAIDNPGLDHVAQEAKDLFVRIIERVGMDPDL